VTDQNALDSEFFSSRQVSKARGGVSPIGWTSQPEITLIDEALNDYDVVWAASGHPHAVYPTTYAELITCTGAQPMVVGD
jgi:prolyl-tRNA editing enzyme YbaK/EbsC (Cys-tRNA(Pro) deacylase)